MRARPPRRQPFRIMERNFAIVAVVDDERGYLKRRNALVDLDVSQGDAGLLLERRAKRGQTLIAEPDQDGEPADDVLHGGGRRDQHHRADVEPALDRKHGRGAAKGVRDYSRKGTQLTPYPAHRFRMLDHVGPRPGGLAVSRAIHRDHAEAGGRKRRHESAKLGAASFPTVQEQDDGTRSPRARREPESEGDPLTAVRYLSFPRRSMMPSRRAEQAQREAASCLRRDVRERTDGGSHEKHEPGAIHV